MKLVLKTVATVAGLVVVPAFAAQTGGYAGDVTGGGSVTPVTVNSYEAMLAAVKAYKNSTAGLVITYTGNEDALINAAALDPCGQHDKAVRVVRLKGLKNVTIQGADGSSANFGIKIQDGSSNVIVRNMKFGYIPGGSKDGDALSMEGVSNVWIDHNEFFDANVDEAYPTFTPDGKTKPTQVWCPGTSGNDTAYDGAMDIKHASTGITISYNYIHDHHKVGLDGSSDSDLQGNITFHHNYYYNVGARIPLQRGGLTHEYNNYYNTVTTSGINVRMGGQALIEGNWIQNALNMVTSRDSKAIGYWDLRNNNVASPADFGTYNLTWVAPTSTKKPYKNATDWSTTKAFPAVTYTYKADSPVCVKNNLFSVVGVGKNYKTLTCN